MTQPAPRTIARGYSATTPVQVDDTTGLFDWLAAKALEYTFEWLLLHAETGVVWGELRGAELALSSSAKLSWNMLQQARLFGKHGELFVWQGPHSPQARLIIDSDEKPEEDAGKAAEWIDEQQMLWGYAREGETLQRTNGFVLLTEGSQGIAHAPPIGDSLPVYRKPNEKQLETDRARLLVRHYVCEDDCGVMRVDHSRLVQLVKPGEK